MSTQVHVPVPGCPGAEIIVRTPDLPTLLANGWLPLPLVQAVSETIRTGAEPQWVIETDDELETEKARFVERWICACAVQPRIVLETDEATDDALHIDEVGRALRMAILEATYLPLLERTRVAAAALECFVRDGAEALVLAAFARAYTQRPSALAGVVDPLTSLDFDLALALRLASKDTPPRRTH